MPYQKLRYLCFNRHLQITAKAFFLLVIDSMAFCFNCGQQLSTSEKFCPNCGQNLSDRTDSKGSTNISGNKGDVIGVGISGSGNVIGKNIVVGSVQ